MDTAFMMYEDIWHKIEQNGLAGTQSPDKVVPEEGGLTLRKFTCQF
jgi:hypothetical protein